MIKRISSIFLLFVFLFNSFGYLAFFKLEQWKIHAAVKIILSNPVPEERLEAIKISKENMDQFEWESGTNEFKYQGKMYDIVRSVKGKDVVTYYCISDRKETQLYTSFNELVTKQTDNDRSPSNSPAKKMLKIFFSFDYLLPDKLMLTGENNSSLKIFACSLLHSSDFYTDIAPPPRPVA